MSAHQQGGPGASDPQDPTELAGDRDVWGTDELDEMLSDPPCAGRLGQILAAAGAPAEAGRQPGEEAALRAFRAAFPAPRSGRTHRARVARVSGRAAAAALAGGLVLSGGAAAAATGVLPGAAQQTAKSVLARVGVSVPGPNEHAGGHPGARGKSTQAPGRSTPRPSATARGNDRSGTGSEVSGVARSTASTGVDKGAAVSGTANDGKSRAGQRGTATRPSAGATRPSAGKKTPTPVASKRRNGSSHKPESAGPSRTAPPKGNSLTSGSAGERP